MVDTIYWIWMQLLFGFGTARAHQMSEQYKNPEELHRLLKAGEGSPNLLFKEEKSNWQKAFEQAEHIKEVTLKKKCQIITPDHENYPPLLQHIYGKPLALYVKGDLSVLRESLSFTLVGARRYTKYGEKVAAFIAEGLAYQGATVVSGLALGIDSICHQGALSKDGKTIGVLACGLDYDYPKGNAKLKRAISENGAVVTEYPMGTIPKPYMFPPRNRVMAGMTNGVVVIEAGSASGSLITAKYALENSRDLFVVPGGIFSGTFEGSHRLLKEGAAKLTANAMDILEEYPGGITKREAPPQKREPETIETARPRLPEGLDPLIYKMIAVMTKDRQTADEIANKVHGEIGAVLGGLTMLELLGLIRSHPGGYFSLS